MPLYKQIVEESVTKTQVHKIQILARPTAFCFIRYKRPEIEVKCVG